MTAASRPRAVPPPTPGALGLLFGLMLRAQVTRARVVALGALGLVGVLVGVALGQARTFHQVLTPRAS